MIIIKMDATTTNVTNIIHERPVSSSNAFIILPTPKIGANKRVVNITPMMLWIWLISFVVRVIRDDLEILFSSWFENFKTFL